jgi:hypothetical protein
MPAIRADRGEEIYRPAGNGRGPFAGDGAVGRLTAAAASVIREDGQDGTPDHVVMADPAGNEFCFV